jgi:Cu/Ag efflux protein CusF
MACNRVIRAFVVLGGVIVAAPGFAQSTEYNTGPSGSAGAEPNSTTRSPAASAGAKGQGALSSTKLHGSVKSVDVTAKQLTLSDGEQLKVQSSTKIAKDGRQASLEDVKQGDDVRASFSPGDTEKVEQIIVTSSGKSSGSSTSPHRSSRSPHGSSPSTSK